MSAIIWTGEILIKILNRKLHNVIKLLAFVNLSKYHGVYSIVLNPNTILKGSEIQPVVWDLYDCCVRVERKISTGKLTHCGALGIKENVNILIFEYEEVGSCLKTCLEEEERSLNRNLLGSGEGTKGRPRYGEGLVNIVSI